MQGDSTFQPDTVAAAEVIDISQLLADRKQAISEQRAIAERLAQQQVERIIAAARQESLARYAELGLTPAQVWPDLVAVTQPPALASSGIAPAASAAAAASNTQTTTTQTAAGKKRNPNPTMKYSFTDGSDIYYWGGAGFPKWAKRFPQILSAKQNSIDKSKMRELTAAEQSAYDPAKDAAKKS